MVPPWRVPVKALLNRLAWARKQCIHKGVNELNSFLHPFCGGVDLAVKLQPRASKNEICGPLGDELKIKVTAPPVEAAANQALLDLLAEKLDCPRGAVRIVRGQTSRHKIVRITGLDAPTILRRLCQ